MIRREGVAVWERLAKRTRDTLAGVGLGPGAGQPPHMPSRAPFTILRRQLVLTHVVVVALVLLILSAAIYAFEARVEAAQVDAQVASEAQSETAKGLPTTPESGAEEHEEPYRPSSPNLFTILLAAPDRIAQDDDQVARLGLPDWASARPVLSGRQPSMYATVERAGTHLRLYTVPIRAHGQIVGAVQAGVSLSAYEEHMRALLGVLVLLDGAVLLATAGASLWLTRRALVPAQAAYLRQRQFAAGASHELRTPLALIRSQAELIAGHRCDPAPAAERSAGTAAVAASADAAEGAENEVAADAREIIQEVEYMSRLVSDLLVLARDDSGGQALAHAPLDLAALVREVAAKVRPLAEAHGLTLAAEPLARAAAHDAHEGHEGHEALFVRGDADRLRQLLLILLDNAVRYTPAGGAVRLGAEIVRRPHLGRERAGAAVLTVSDTGVGIAPEHLPHIFEPFYRVTAQPGRQRTEGSTGLGLALAQWIVQAHHGTISVKSAPGSGSTFTVTLPLAPAATERGAEQEA